MSSRPQHATYADLQAHIANLDASYQHEDATLIAQFETQRRMLANEHANKMQREISVSHMLYKNYI